MKNNNKTRKKNNISQCCTVYLNVCVYIYICMYHLILLTLKIRYSYLHFTDEKTEIHWASCPKLHHRFWLCVCRYLWMPAYFSTSLQHEILNGKTVKMGNKLTWRLSTFSEIRAFPASPYYIENLQTKKHQDEWEQILRSDGLKGKPIIQGQ